MPKYQTQKQQKYKTKEKKNQGFVKGPRRKNLRNRRSSVPWKTEQLRPEKFVTGARSNSLEQNRNDGRNKQKRQTLGAGKERKTRVKEKEKSLKPKTQGN